MGRIVPFVGPSARRPDPELRFSHPWRAPAGVFAANAVANGRLHVELVPPKTAPWEAVEEFALTYDGYAYWNDVVELAGRALRRWTRHGTLPDGIDELRACLFFEERRWHHFGEEPHGRAARYVADLLDAIGSAVASAADTAAVRAAG